MFPRPLGRLDGFNPCALWPNLLLAVACRHGWRQAGSAAPLIGVVNLHDGLTAGNQFSLSIQTAAKPGR